MNRQSAADYLDRAGRQRSPSDLRKWAREVVGVSQYISRLADTEEGSDPKYRVRQRLYYSARLAVLLANPPRIPDGITWRKMLDRAAK